MHEREAGLALDSAAQQDILPAAVLRKLGSRAREAALKDILMKIAIRVRRPHAHKEFNFAVIRQMLICCLDGTPVHSLRPQKATIRRPPASSTFEGVIGPPAFRRT